MFHCLVVALSALILGSVAAASLAAPQVGEWVVMGWLALLVGGPVVGSLALDVARVELFNPLVAAIVCAFVGLLLTVPPSVAVACVLGLWTALVLAWTVASAFRLVATWRGGRPAA